MRLPLFSKGEFECESFELEQMHYLLALILTGQSIFCQLEILLVKTLYCYVLSFVTFWSFERKFLMHLFSCFLAAVACPPDLHLSKQSHFGVWCHEGHSATDPCAYTLSSSARSFLWHFKCNKTSVRYCLWRSILWEWLWNNFTCRNAE